MMHKIDADEDGTISHNEYIAYQVKIFDMMDTSTAHKGMIGSKRCLQRAVPIVGDQPVECAGSARLPATTRDFDRPLPSDERSFDDVNRRVRPRAQRW